jgi:hypothetical protein
MMTKAQLEDPVALRRRIMDLEGVLAYAINFLPGGLQLYAKRVMYEGYSPVADVPQEVWQQMGNWAQNSLGQLGQNASQGFSQLGPDIQGAKDAGTL